MKYIPGFKFRALPPKVSTGGSVLAQAQKNKKLMRDKIFKAGSEYVIHHIIPEQNEVKYFFLVDGVVEQVSFNSIKEAEQRISKFVGDK